MRRSLSPLPTSIEVNLIAYMYTDIVGRGDRCIRVLLAWFEIRSGYLSYRKIIMGVSDFVNEAAHRVIL